MTVSKYGSRKQRQFSFIENCKRKKRNTLSNNYSRSSVNDYIKVRITETEYLENKEW